MHAFTSIGLRDDIARAMAALGFTEPTEIQAKAAGPILSGASLFLSSATGTGKTFAYMAPVFSTIDAGSNELSAVFVAPTHDLAAQLYREAERLAAAAGSGLRVAQALGSMPLKRQLERLADKPQVVIGSAGRIRDLIAQRELDARALRYIVLDEGDRLFEKEAIDITASLLDSLPDACARLIVSATIADRTVERSKRWFSGAERLALDSAEALRGSIEHWCFHASPRDKTDFVRRFEAAVRPSRCLIFASSNAALFNLARKMEHYGIDFELLKSDKSGNERRDAVGRFASGQVRWLLTTDLGARGLDIADVSHVMSFDLPEEPSIYVHRAGRTGRAGKSGISIAVADLVELKRASKIAVRYGFPFMCKILEAGRAHDIEPENFFAIAEEEEAARTNVKLEAPKAGSQRRASRVAGSPRPSERPRARTADPMEYRGRAPSKPDAGGRGPRRYADRPVQASPEGQAQGGEPKDKGRDASAKRRATSPQRRAQGKPANAPDGAAGQQGKAGPSSHRRARARKNRGGEPKPGASSQASPGGDS